MNSNRFDSDRAILAAAILIGLTGVGLYVVLFLTVLTYGQLNISGQVVERLALLLTAATMVLAMYLALAARSRALTSPALSGAGWFMVAAGFMLAFPSLGGLSSFAAAPGVQAFSGVAGAIFLIIGGAGLLQAERTVRNNTQSTGRAHMPERTDY